MNYKTLMQIQECAKTYLQPVMQTSQLQEIKIINPNNKQREESRQKPKKKQPQKTKPVVEEPKYVEVTNQKVVKVESNKELEVWQQAVILSEIIGPPVSKRRRGYRNRVGRI